MSYASAIEHLYARGFELAPRAGDVAAPRRKFDLAHMRSLAKELGDPQGRFRSVLIAGTNGKGSTSATLASVLTAAGRRVGLYTSPHLVRVNERIRVSKDGELFEISDDAFAEIYFQVDDAATRLVDRGELPFAPSFFEVMTAVAFQYFAREGAEIAVLEVGLGGRLDATNIVQPELSIITDISLDHTEWLGDTITAIAQEKAGILRQGGRLITLSQHPEANAAIGETAVALDVTGINAAAYLPTRDVNGPRNQYDVQVRDKALHIDSPLPGQHQQRNIALAIAAAVELEIPNDAIERGIRLTDWPGRLQYLNVHGHPVLLDVAHNPAGIWTLRSYLSSLKDEAPRTLLFSVLGDKALTEMAQVLFTLFDERDGHRILLAPMSNPRAATEQQLRDLAATLDTPVQVFPSVAEAWKAGLALDGLLVVAGSVYLIGEIHALLAGPTAGARA